MLNARFLQLPRNSTISLRDQVCELVSSAVARDLFPASEPLPSCRVLAAHLGVSRNTVHDAYCRLIDIGLVTAHARRGYFIKEATAAKLRSELTGRKQKRGLSSPLDRNFAGKERPSDMPRVDHPDNWNAYPYPFVYNQTEPALFPIRAWRESMRVAMATSNLQAWNQDRADSDSAKLVRQLQQRLLGYRGISASDDQILITSGAQNAIYLLGSLNAYLGGRVAVEDPCYPEARNAFAVSGNDVVAVPVDREGLCVDRIPEDVGLVYTTPSHQFPTTVTMSETRRHALCARAGQNGFLICEDDYEAEMNFVRKRGRPLRSMDISEQTVYLGSLSKSIAPGLRIGYMVAHEDIIREIKAIRRYMMRHPPTLLQEAMAHFIASGALDVHLRRTERRYRKRWEVTREALDRHLPDFEVEASQGGTCFWLTCPEGIDTTTLAKRLRPRGVLIDEGRVFYSDPRRGQRKMRIGFTALSQEDVQAGIRIIAEEAQQMRKQSDPICPEL